MARFEFRLPDIGEGIAEAEIVAWHVKVGDSVSEDQGLADMMTDKATVEMESPVAGVVVELAGEVGDQVPIGSTLVVIDVEGEATADPVADMRVEEQPKAEKPGLADAQGKTPEYEAAPQSDSPAPVEGRADDTDNRASMNLASMENDGAVATHKKHALASPAVRQRAKELGVDLIQVQTDGDRIRHADLDAFLRYGSGQGYHAPHASRGRDDEVIKVIGMRRRIAENMAASKRNIPHFTYVDEINVTALEEIRADLNANRGQRPKLTMLPLLIVAICRSLPQFPMLNARYDDEAGFVTRSGRVHLGMAAQTDAGLTVPVIRDAQDKNVWQLASEIGRLAEAARGGRLRPDEMGGGTITVTSLGPLGGIATTPVINRPEVAIIGPNKIVERPVFAKNSSRGDEIRRAKLMNLSISCDHRVVDGWDAASYVAALRRLIETPVLLFAPDGK